MNFDESLTEQKMSEVILRLRSTLHYIDEDIGNVMKRVSRKSYQPEIPNLFEKLTLFGEDLKKIKVRLRNTMEQIDAFNNRLSTRKESDAAVFDSDIIEEYHVIISQMEKLKIDYKLLKSKIILFTGSLEKNV